MTNLAGNHVYITSAGAFLPNDPIENHEIEQVLGLVGGKPSHYRELVLNANGIKKRYYAMNREGRATHLNEELAANAINAALSNRKLSIEQIDFLATATTIPDLKVPGFASMVHGRLGGRNSMDILSAGGVCASSMAALKSACNSIRIGEHSRAVVVGAEMASSVMKASRFEKESTIDKRSGVPASYQYFNADFLRWMLSDGAGALILEREPNPNALSLRIDWISLRSFAHLYPLCMYMGTSRPDNIQVGSTYQSKDTFQEAESEGLFLLRQDTQLLAKGLEGSVLVEAQRLMQEGKIESEKIDHFLPHVSSMFFCEDYVKKCHEVGLTIPESKWFTNLTYKGNTGAASIFIMLEEALNTGRFTKGDRILCMVPESGRFTVSYAQFTCI